MTSILGSPGGVEVTDGNGQVDHYDGVVIAAHPGQALAMLAAPTALQREVLCAMPYSANVALLHTDTSILPKAEAARASWNFLRPAAAAVTDRVRSPSPTTSPASSGSTPTPTTW